MFLGRAAVEQSVLTIEQLRGPLVARVIQGVYRPSWIPLTHELKCRAAALVFTDGTAVTGRSAATLLGVPLAGPTDAVEVCTPEGHPVRRRQGVRVRQFRDDCGRLIDHDGIPVAPPHRMAFDLAARTSLPEAVARLDAVTRAGLLDLTAFTAWLDGRRDNDVVAVRAATCLVDPRAESAPESWTRIILQGAGFDVTPQHEIRLCGRVIARADLALVDLRIAVEYDGGWHALREQLARDRQRLNDLAQAGWLVVHVTADMLRDPARVIAAVQSAVRQRVAHPA